MLLIVSGCRAPWAGPAESSPPIATALGDTIGEFRPKVHDSSRSLAVLDYTDDRKQQYDSSADGSNWIVIGVWSSNGRWNGKVVSVIVIATSEFTPAVEQKMKRGGYQRAARSVSSASPSQD